MNLKRKHSVQDPPLPSGEGSGEGHAAATAVRLLLHQRATLAVAESCTGGLITHLLTEVPGISASLLMGVTAYSNEVKINQLGVPASLIEKEGAVSRKVALAMAAGAARAAGADYGIGVTGNAGPSGGSDEKPVGLVWIALCGPETSDSREFHFSGDRSQVKEKAALAAINMLEDALANC